MINGQSTADVQIERFSKPAILIDADGNKRSAVKKPGRQERTIVREQQRDYVDLVKPVAMTINQKSCGADTAHIGTGREMAGGKLKSARQEVSFAGANRYKVASAAPQGGQQAFSRAKSVAAEYLYAMIQCRCGLEHFKCSIRGAAFLDDQLEIRVGLRLPGRRCSLLLIQCDYGRARRRRIRGHDRYSMARAFMDWRTRVAITNGFHPAHPAELGPHSSAGLGVLKGGDVNGAIVRAFLCTISRIGRATRRYRFGGGGKSKEGWLTMIGRHLLDVPALRSF